MGQEKKKETKLLAHEKRAMDALKAKMSKYKKGSKQYKAAMSKMRALKGKIKRRVAAAKKAGMKKGKRQEKKKETKLLAHEKRAIHALKAKMSKYKKGSKQYKAAMRK